MALSRPPVIVLVYKSSTTRRAKKAKIAAYIWWLNFWIMRMDAGIKHPKMKTTNIWLMCSFQKLLKVPTKKGSAARFQKISVYVGRPVWGAVLWTSRFLNPTVDLLCSLTLAFWNRIWINTFFCCTAPIFRVQPLHPEAHLCWKCVL